MNYNELMQLAEKRAFVRWLRSGTIERLIVNNGGGKHKGQIVALSLLRTNEHGAPAAHFIYRNNVDGVEKLGFDAEEVTTVSINTANRLICIARSFTLSTMYAQQEFVSAPVMPRDDVAATLETVIT